MKSRICKMVEKQIQYLVYCKYSISKICYFEKKYKIRENLIKFNTHKIRLRLKICLLLM